MSTALQLTTDFPAPPAPFDPAKVKELTIDSQATYELACEGLKEIKGVRRQIELDRKQLKEGVLRAGRAIDDKARTADAPWKSAEETLAPRITGYLAEQERIRREEQKRLEAEQRRIAEEEQLAAAEAALAAGASQAEAEAILTEEPPLAPMPIAPPRVERVAGVSTVETWSAVVESKSALIEWAARYGRVELLEVNQVALNAMARAQRGAMKVPGVKAVCTRGVRARL